MDYTDINSKVIDSWVDQGWEWSKPINHQEFLNAQKGQFKMVLTPHKDIPKDWFPDLKGKKVLGLASGGGQQMPILAAMGAKCTVFDYSQKQLDAEKMVAKRENYSIEVIKGDMTKTLPFDDESFDFIIQPVANCYIENVQHVWNESFRILKKGGRLLAGMDNGVNYIFDEDETHVCHKLPFNPLKDKQLQKDFPLDDNGIQFSHTLEEQLRGQLKAGFRLVDLYEDTNTEGKLAEYNVPTFWASYAVK